MNQGVPEEISTRCKIFVYDDVGRCIAIVFLDLSSDEERDGEVVWGKLKAKHPDWVDRGESFAVAHDKK